MDYIEKQEENCFSGHFQMSIDNGEGQTYKLSNPNKQMETFHSLNTPFVVNSSSDPRVFDSFSSAAFSHGPAHDAKGHGVGGGSTQEKELCSDLSSQAQQNVFSAAIANLIPKLTTSLDWNVDLNIDVTSPEFIAMVSAAATHYANMSIAPNTFMDSNLQANDSNSTVSENVQSASPPPITESESTSSPITSCSAPSSLIGKTSFPRHRASSRLNKFVRRLHDMLLTEKDKGIVEWRCGLLVLHSTDAFAKTILPKYFNTRNFKTFRRQLNYYGFVHVRSFSATGSTTTALWVNQELASKQAQISKDCDNISTVLLLKRVDPCPDAKTAEGRRVRKEEAVNTVEDIGINTQWMQLSQIKRLSKTKEPLLVNQTSNSSYSNENFFHQHDNVTTAPNIENNLSSTEESIRNLIPSSLECNPNDGNEVHVDSSYNEQTAQKVTDVESETYPLTIKANNQIKMSSCDDAANLLLNLSRSACVTP